MEDIAENFLHELINRSLFQVAETFFNKILTCRIHDLLRDLAVQKAMEVNLLDIYDPRVNSVTPFRHRHAIYAETQRYLSLDLSELKWKDTDAAGLINLQELSMERIRKSYSLKFMGSLKSLTTLFLVCQYGETFPPLEPLSSCENIRRLWISGGIEELADLNKLPKSITDPMPILGKFPNLKHLELSWAYKGMKITCKGNSFGQLETLKLGNLEKLENWHLDTTAMSLIKSLSVFECPKLKKIPERMEHFAVLDVSSIAGVSPLYDRHTHIHSNGGIPTFKVGDAFPRMISSFVASVEFNDTVYAIFMSHAMIAAAVAVFMNWTLPFSNDEARKDNRSL
ncbi:hypothetical protein KY289_022853 [Solanum tuberosum]|nr:hypothetical protein KY289_021652 [Solanum tuberosum]KAH0685101.1 hypothetical protein KY289_022853 [Solanum tuberosum]